MVDEWFLFITMLVYWKVIIKSFSKWPTFKVLGIIFFGRNWSSSIFLVLSDEQMSKPAKDDEQMNNKVGVVRTKRRQLNHQLSNVKNQVV